MMTTIVILFVVFFAVRLAFLAVSIKNEKRLIAKGAVQIGEKTSKLLATAHIVYYFAALISAYYTKVSFNGVSAFGAVMVALSLMILAYIIRQLGEIWTVKVYIAPNHIINRSWLFSTFKHPNYFLNIVPELIGIGLLCQAWGVMMIGLPIYAMILAKRIREEETAMAHLF